jgi:type IV pilus assembly protein PilE
MKMIKQRGFTLIEVMIVAAIIALLAGIGLPSYRDYVLRGQLANATADLANSRIRYEQFFQDNRTYDGGPCPASTKYFDYACADDATTYTITATGKDSTAGFVYTINQANTKATTSVPAGWNTAAACWITRKGDSC